MAMAFFIFINAGLVTKLFAETRRRRKKEEGLPVFKARRQHGAYLRCIVSRPSHQRLRCAPCGTNSWARGADNPQFQV